MNWVWLSAVLLLSLTPLYLLGLIGYRLVLSLRSVERELASAKLMLDELNEINPQEVTEAVAATAADLDELIGQRLVLKQRKEQRRAARQRRLIARLHEAEETH